VADDIITFGGPERWSQREADQSVESLFHAHYPRIVYTAFSLVGDWYLAEQLAQEAYLRLWRRWRWISDPQAAPMYLQRTVVNLSRETIRRKVIERRALQTKGADRAAPPGPDPAALVELRRAVAALPIRKRECVVLRFLLGLSEAETAEVLGISVGTVKSQTHKGLRQLRYRLEDPGAAAPASAPAPSTHFLPAPQIGQFGVGGGQQAAQAAGSPADGANGGSRAAGVPAGRADGAGQARRPGRTAP
jgi:RNA polymerase sigma-70 factor (sigma-E family)